MKYNMHILFVKTLIISWKKYCIYLLFYLLLFSPEDVSLNSNPNPSDKFIIINMLNTFYKYIYIQIWHAWGNIIRKDVIYFMKNVLYLFTIISSDFLPEDVGLKSSNQYRTKIPINAMPCHVWT